MSLKKYLKDHRLHLLLGLLAEGVAEAVLWLFASPVALQGFAFFWLTGSIGVIFGYDFLRKRKFYKKVEENLSQLEEKYLLTELLDEPEFLEGQILCRVIQEMEHSSRSGKMENLNVILRPGSMRSRFRSQVQI